MKKSAHGVVLAAAGLCFFAPAQAQELSFTRDIVPILKSRCVACHMSGDEQGALALAPKLAYDSLVNVPSTESALPRVKPGAPEESYLVLKLEGTHLTRGGKGVQMPMGSSPLSRETLDRIRAWIAAGALRD
jgi:mono/diheme cytochrome c family protein